MANAINSLKFGSDTYTLTLPYGTCSTAAGTAAKTVDVDNFSLETGARVLVKFTVTNTASSPTLNVESTGAKAIYYRGSAVSAGYLAANRTYEFVYNGTQWDLIGDLDTNTNTDTKVTHSRTTTSSFRPVILHSLYTDYGTDPGTATDQLYYNEVFAAQPSTGTFKATTFAGALSGNADSATKLKTARTISLTGDVTGSASFDGSNNASITATVKDDSHNHVISNVDGLQTALDDKADYVGSSATSQEAEYYIKICTVDMPIGYNDVYFEFDMAGRTATRFQKVKCTIYKANTANDHVVMYISGNNGNAYSVCAYRYIDSTNGDYVEIWGKVPSWDTLNILKKSWADNNSSLKASITWNMTKATSFPTESSTIVKVTATSESWSGNASTATTATKLGTADVGSATQPIYLDNGVPKATTYTLGKSVPSDAKFTDTTYSNMTAATSSAAGKAGLVPAPAAGKQASFLRGDGTWVVPTNTTYSNFVKSGSGAKAGLVPAPSTTAGTTKYLREDGTWAVPPDTNTTYTFNGAVSTIKDSNLTASRALISNSSGKVAVSAVTSTELGYLDGVTSGIQAQLNAAQSRADSAYELAESKPSVLSGTATPSASLGNNGDIYIMY